MLVGQSHWTSQVYRYTAFVRANVSGSILLVSTGIQPMLVGQSHWTSQVYTIQHLLELVLVGQSYLSAQVYSNVSGSILLIITGIQQC